MRVLSGSAFHRESHSCNDGDYLVSEVSLAYFMPGNNLVVLSASAIFLQAGFRFVLPVCEQWLPR
jgi:hypothetical protein